MTTDTPSSARFGPYSIRREIARGGMGVVYEAEDLAGIRVALKVPRIELRADEQERARFLREMQLTAKLRHPNIVRILHGADDHGQLYLAMEYVEGMSLRDELRQRSRLSVPEAVKIARQVAQALAAAHSHDPPIVHRDLTPGNVMLGTDGVVKVVDFGIAKAFDATAAATTDPIGTLAYMSPEQLDGTLSTPATDVHALGVIIYEMIVGAPPFPASLSPKELISKICSAAPASMSRAVTTTIPNGLDALVSRCLEKRPSERPHADALAQELARIEKELLAAKERRSAAPSTMEQQRHSGFRVGRVESFRSLAATTEPGALDTVALVERFEERSRARPVVIIAGSVLLMMLAVAVYLALGSRDASNGDDTIAVLAKHENADEGGDALQVGRNASEGSGGTSEGTHEAAIREDLPRAPSTASTAATSLAAPRTPRVSIAKTTIQGLMNKEAIRRVIRSHVDDVRRCYDQGLARDPDLEGRVSIEFPIDYLTGKVDWVMGVKSTLEDSSVGKCIAKAARGWKFPRAPNVPNSVVIVSFVLEPG